MQPSPESYASLSRRALDIEDYLDILRRHKGWIAAPAFLALVVAVVVAFLWPDTFVSTAVIRVVPQQVPENYVPPNINSEISQRINSMYQTISAREKLTNLITTLNLYPKERQSKPMADIVDKMRRSINVRPVVPLAQQTGRELTALSISFSYQDRYVARRVTDELVGRFMSENTRERSSQSARTTLFLEDQVQSAKRELEAIEAKLATFRTSSAGRLPEQVQANQQRLNSLEQRIGNLNAGLSRITQDKMLLESDLRTLKAQRATLVPPPDQVSERQKNERLVATERNIVQLEAALAGLRQQYKDTYPDVRRVRDRLEFEQRQREALLKQEQQEEQAQANQPEPAVSARRYDPRYDREMRQLDAAIERLEAQMKAKDSESEQHRKSIDTAEQQIKVIQGRIEATPLSEQEYGQVIRDREMAKMRYDGLSQKRALSQTAQELENRQQGENLELLDEASLPVKPTEPKRPMIIGAGALLGFVLGLFLAGAREAKDTSLKNLKDVRAYTQLTILGSVPLLENDSVVRRRKRLAWLAWSTACLVGIGIMTGAVVYYYTSQG